MRTLLLLLLHCSCITIFSQEIQITLLDDTVMSTEAHPTLPTLFHFTAFNSSEETLFVDFIKLDEGHPEDWDVSLCTDAACLPPEDDSTTFPVGGMLSEDLSIYFFPRSAGSGWVNVLMYSLPDSIVVYSGMLSLTATAPTGLLEEDISEFFILQDKRLIVEVNESSNLRIFDQSGRLTENIDLRAGRTEIDLSSYITGTYIANLMDRTGRSGQHKFLIH